MKSTKNKRKSEAIEKRTRRAWDRACRIRAKMRVRDPEGKIRLFRSTVSEKGTEDEENEKEADSG